MTYSNGWIKLYRELIDKPIWLNSTPEQKSVLTTLLCMVNYLENQWEFKGKQYSCKPGQLITSLTSIKKRCGKGISIQNVRTAIARFKKLGFLTDESTHHNRLITICNWEVYQNPEDATNSQTNNRLTDGQQTANRRLTTNEEGKKDNKDKNERITHISAREKFQPPTWSEVKDYADSVGYHALDAEAFIAYYEANGWMRGRTKIRNWKACVITWKKRAEERGEDLHVDKDGGVSWERYQEIMAWKNKDNQGDAANGQ